MIDNRSLALTRSEELVLIDEFIRTKGVTHCPSVYLVPIIGGEPLLDPVIDYEPDYRWRKDRIFVKRPITSLKLLRKRFITIH